MVLRRKNAACEFEGFESTLRRDRYAGGDRHWRCGSFTRPERACVSASEDNQEFEIDRVTADRSPGSSNPARRRDLRHRPGLGRRHIAGKEQSRANKLIRCGFYIDSFSSKTLAISSWARPRTSRTFRLSERFRTFSNSAGINRSIALRKLKPTRGVSARLSDLHDPFMPSRGAELSFKSKRSSLLTTASDCSSDTSPWSRSRVVTSAALPRRIFATFAEGSSFRNSRSTSFSRSNPFCCASFFSSGVVPPF